MYRDYIALGRMDYLYDKVGLYDAVRAVIQGKADTSRIASAQADVLDIESHMLHFLENHDEQRIASPEFAGNSESGMPGMVVSALIGSSPTMLYFGQDVGEPGAGDAGLPNGLPVDEWGIRVEGCRPAGASTSRGGAANGPAAVYARTPALDERRQV